MYEMKEENIQTITYVSDLNVEELEWQKWRKRQPDPEGKEKDTKTNGNIYVGILEVENNWNKDI